MFHGQAHCCICCVKVELNIFSAHSWLNHQCFCANRRALEERQILANLQPLFLFPTADDVGTTLDLQFFHL